MRSLLPVLSLFLAVAALGACSTVQPNRYEGIASSPQLRPNGEDETGRMPYRVSSHVAWSEYDNVLLEPVNVYGGQDGQFDKDVTPRDKEELAGYMRTVFSERLGKRFRLVREERPRTLRVRLTLTGASTNTAFVSTITRFDLAGGPYNAVQGMRGREGAFIGSAMYSVEIFDGSTGGLLDAYVAKQYPNAMNVSATIGRLEAAKVSLEKGADELVAQLK
ncbi:DUF3313 domain-containing protein [Mitsuaria sp. GD03876]|uniref:DUF3313 domain-containing protein n=1 Tax=Mitsuaria sp. GD03876 TaxID=2975399 RepID=UPI002446F3FD|nr:DUF3313 domain-containing protein [Mitsuaria sp. GD03876]MDH0866282.1 DUF3313 domain-containing protein [Mitsuaria sp. GD03876]